MAARKRDESQPLNQYPHAERHDDLRIQRCGNENRAPTDGDAPRWLNLHGRGKSNRWLAPSHRA